MDVYEQILRIVENKPKKIKLQLELEGKGGLIGNTEEIQSINSDILYVDGEIITDENQIDYDSGSDYSDGYDSNDGAYNPDFDLNDSE